MAWYEALAIRFAEMPDLDDTDREIIDAAKANALDVAATLSDADRGKAARLAIQYGQTQ